MVASLMPVLTPLPLDTELAVSRDRMGSCHGQADHPGPGLTDRLGKNSLTLAIGLSWEGVHSPYADI